MKNGQSGQHEDEIGVLVERLEMGWITRFGKPDLFRVTVSGRTHNDPHPILKEIFDILGMQRGVEQNIEFSSLRKKYVTHFSQSVKTLQLNLTMGEVANLSWEGSHVLCFELIESAH